MNHSEYIKLLWDIVWGPYGTCMVGVSWGYDTCTTQVRTQMCGTCGVAPRHKYHPSTYHLCGTCVVAKIFTTERIFTTEHKTRLTSSDDEQNERHWAEAAWPLP
jgi:hypothetical protein